MFNKYNSPEFQVARVFPPHPLPSEQFQNHVAISQVGGCLKNVPNRTCSSRYKGDYCNHSAFLDEFIQAEHFMLGSTRGGFLVLFWGFFVAFFGFVLFLNTQLISLMDFGNWKLENNNKILLKPGTESTNLLLLFMQTIFSPMISLKNISHIGAVVLY